MLGAFGGVAALLKVTRPPLPTDDVQLLLSDVALAARAPYRCEGSGATTRQRPHADDSDFAFRLDSGMEYGYHVGSSPTYGKLSVDVLCPAAIPGAAQLTACSTSVR